MEFKRTFKRLKKDVWAIVSLTYILLICFTAVFAYQIVPDKTENANQMHLSIHSKPPGFSCKVLTIPGPLGTEKKFSLSGQINSSDEIPIQEIIWKEDAVFFKRYGNATNYFEEVSLNLFPKELSKKEIEKIYLKNKYFFLGTDKYGRDLFSRLIIGSRISISIGIIAVIISLILGLFFGMLAGFYGGWIDRIILWLINVVWSIPTLLMVIAITLALGRGFWQVFVAVGLTMWVEVARLTRGLVKTTKQELFVKAGKILGFSKGRLILNHILPITIAPLIVISTSNFASAILVESGLSFLGIGAQPPIPSWGSMVKDHFRYLLLGKPYLTLVPGIAIMTLVLSFMILGNSLRDALDVRN